MNISGDGKNTRGYPLTPQYTGAGDQGTGLIQRRQCSVLLQGRLVLDIGSKYRYRCPRPDFHPNLGTLNLYIVIQTYLPSTGFYIAQTSSNNPFCRLLFEMFQE